MSRSLRGLCAAAVLTAVAAAVLLIGAAQPATAQYDDVSSASYYTPAQQSNTKAVLEAFGAAIPELGKTWTGDDFCTWLFVTCFESGVNLDDPNDRINPTGTLPNIPDFVDGAEVLLSDLYFYNWTSVSGTLPDSWGRLLKIRGIRLWFLPVSGTLPSSWLQLSNLDLLEVVGGQLTGSLPESWSSLPKMDTINLQNNSLSGSLPESWARMTNLHILNLQNNDFCGCVPSSWLDATFKESVNDGLSVDNTGPECATTYACPATTTTTTTTTSTSTTTTTTPTPVTDTTTTTSAPVTCVDENCASCDSQDSTKCVSCKNNFSLQQGACVKAASPNGSRDVSLHVTTAAVCAGALLLLLLLTGM